MTLTPKELAVRFNTDPRTLRKFLRSEDGKGMRVGKGQRWAIEAREAKSLKRRFDAWDARRTQNATTDANEADAPESPTTD